jgi:hypothetical protein
MMYNIDQMFDHHPPRTENAVNLHAALRREVKTTAAFFIAELPDSPEKTLAVRKLQEALMWANASVACNS